MQAQELEQRDWGAISQIDQDLSHVSLKLILSLSEREVALGVCFVGNLGRQGRHLDPLRLEERSKDLVEVNKVAVAFVDDPLVRALKLV